MTEVPVRPTLPRDASDPPATRRHAGRTLLRALRPRQWTKNLLVFVAPGAAGILTHSGPFLRSLAAFAIFCAAASGTYLVNDSLDVEADRLHPTKRHRPIASGAFPIRWAIAVSFLLLGGALAGASLLAGWRMALVVGAYVVITVSYSIYLKREPVIELAAVASGFVLRAIAGGVATHIPLSSWFLVVTSFGALFLVTGKRMAEHRHLGDDRGAHRQVLGHYSSSFLQSVLVLTATVTVTAYCLWAFERGGLADQSHHHLSTWIELTVIPVVLGVLYVLRLLDAGRGGAPEELALHDRMLQALGLVWVVLMAVGLYA